MKMYYKLRSAHIYVYFLGYHQALQPSHVNGPNPEEMTLSTNQAYDVFAAVTTNSSETVTNEETIYEQLQ